MKQILISPHHIKNQKIQQLATSSYISDYFLENGFIPVMPVFHSSLKNKSEISQLASFYISNSSALVLQGGQNVAREPRDIFEEVILELALAKKIPVFGICRGFQLINTYFGGSLKNIESHVNLKDISALDYNFNTVDLELKHAVNLTPEGLLEKILLRNTIEVNSAHSQGIDILGTNLRIEAVDAGDELVEAFSCVEQKILAVQWHPELDLNNQMNRLLFNNWLGWI